jgi:hypothetical protein
MHNRYGKNLCLFQVYLPIRHEDLDNKSANILAMLDGQTATYLPEHLYLEVIGVIMEIFHLARRSNSHQLIY